MTHPERLYTYVPTLSPQIVHRAAVDAEIRANLEPGELFEMLDMPEPTLFEFNGKEVEVLDIIPEEERNPGTARVFHLGVGNGLDDNQRYQMASNFMIDPYTRLVAFGERSYGNSAGALTLADARKVYKGDLRPILDPRLRYLNHVGVEQSEHNGFSASAARVFPMASRAEAFDHRVTKATAIDPANVVTRGRPYLPHIAGMATLGVDFAKTGGPLGDYVKANGDPSFEAARADSMMKMVKYLLSIGLPTNLAISGDLATDRFETDAIAALEADRELQGHIVSGTKSELAKHARMQAINSNLAALFPGQVSVTYLEGVHHNGVNYTPLQAALAIA